jgi:hypothetical protein
VINFQIGQFVPRPDVRFGMVLYRDIGDEYRTRVIPFTDDLKTFSSKLNQVQAGGGGDTPEDVQKALEIAIKELAWRERGVKVAFLIGDAPPHLDYRDEAYSYVEAMREAARRAIKIAAIGASGLDRQAEVVWRQLAQYTMGPFVFLTAGERGDSEGSASSVSHHVGSNWAAENLDAIVVRMIKVELSHYTPTGAPPTEDYFSATQGAGVQPDPVLEDLFVQATRQLVDYCVQRLEPGTPTLVLPVKVADKKLGKMAEKLEGRITLGLSRLPQFQLIDARNQPELVKLQGAQYDLKYDSSRAVELGKLVPAKLAVFSELTVSAPGQMEMIIKLVRLETAEILSVSLLKIDEGLLVVRGPAPASATGA